MAREALNRKVGARGLRMILEELMLDLMYHLPSNKKIKELEITAEMVQKRDLSVTCWKRPDRQTRLAQKIPDRRAVAIRADSPSYLTLCAGCISSSPRLSFHRIRKFAR